MLRAAGLKLSSFQRGFSTKPWARATGIRDNLGPLAHPLPPNYQVPELYRRAVPTQVTTLSNGLRVATEETPGETATIGVWIEAGSRWEDEKTNGVAHFLEHLLFKGTPKRSRVQLEKQIEDMGASLNAYTSREHTVFYARSRVGDVNNCADILSDILSNSVLDPAAIDAERAVILQEATEVAKNKAESVFDMLHSTAYQGTPLGFTILGSEENIKSITRNDLVKYINDNYLASRVVISAAGGIKHEDVVKLAEQKFSWLKAGPPLHLRSRPAPAIFTGGEIEQRNDDQSVTNAVIAWEAPSLCDADTTAMQVLQFILGSWNNKSNIGINTSSQMCRKLAQDGYVSNVMTFFTQYSDTGLFGVYFDVPHAADAVLDDVVWRVVKEPIRLCQKVSKDEVERAKNQLKLALLSSAYDTPATAEDIGRQILNYGRRIPLAEQIARVDAVDEAAVQHVANKYIWDHEMAIVASGQTSNWPDYNWIRGWNYSLLA
eukprot:TRINITY_DN2573_c0_g1::TRINITY_DN2573_c0_g1_i1::g.19274::m.19274 TRINITY_DN2573_c0_g1::TRINITY_DN2573_c0_g1_i1::g.19274  ORF type:complete len:490 (+),score=163.25,sp/Q42290/MPPB_ARATH/48.62/2e-131,Peptidase_M16/PF00675.15/3.3e-45,Peptidase_M16_C/PF05193.16/8.4,Peptidase_M16_C/PF05193.16/1.3e-31 TRINITY_DN2573_c0_g1_i1:51-1520(+)